MPIAPKAPYDSLALITQMVRTLLGDYIANLQPNNAGTLTVNAGGFTVTWTAGNQFTAQMNGVAITIAGAPNVIAAVTSPTTAQLVNQAIVGAGQAFTVVIPTGDIFADSQNYVVPIIVYAWRKVQKQLAMKGHPRLENKVILTSLPVIANLDPGVEQFLTWDGFFDGVTKWTPITLQGCPTLPQDFISPIKVAERQSITGANAQNPNLNRFRLMRPASDGLPGRQKGSWNRQHDWREDGIYLPGSILPMDLELRYAAYLADIAPADTFADTPVPIMGCAESLANYAASTFVTPRGGSNLAPGFDAAGDAALDQITNAQAKLQQRSTYSRRPWGSRFTRRRGFRL